MSHHPSRILIMDDEAMLRKFYSRALTRNNYSVTVVADGQEAVENYQQALDQNEPFDLVILDLHVDDGWDGPTAFSELRKIDPKVNAIACSGAWEDPQIKNYSRFGYRGSFTKPIDFDKLLSTVAEHLDDT